MKKDPHRYDDMLELPHHVSSVHAPMSRINRAAQFAPFAALTGFEDQVEETARITEDAVQLTESEAARLDRRLRFLSERIPQKYSVSVSYFVPDRKKSGGAYAVAHGTLKKADLYERVIVLEENGLSDRLCIPIDRIRAIDGAVFNELALEFL